jgi:hypothetical protein
MKIGDVDLDDTIHLQSQRRRHRFNTVLGKHLSKAPNTSVIYSMFENDHAATSLSTWRPLLGGLLYMPAAFDADWLTLMRNPTARMFAITGQPFLYNVALAVRGDSSRWNGIQALIRLAPNDTSPTKSVLSPYVTNLIFECKPSLFYMQRTLKYFQ